jgi:murein DD-endopeptidase MepM/ murein hydrolase activator NlpD
MRKGIGFDVKAGALLSSIVVFFFIVVSAAIVQAEYLTYMPFSNGQQWYCIQGNNGSFSHQGKLAYAYDFVLPEGENSFGQNILSPIEGTVVSMTTKVPDYQNNAEANKDNNGGWGNTVLIKDTATGIHLRMSHMRQYSLAVSVGDKVTIGQYLGQVGQTGISTNPHVHMQIQEDDSASGQSIKFSFIEGPIEKGVTAESELTPKSFVLDNTGDKSLSHNVSSYQGSKSSGWSTAYAPPNKMVGGSMWTKKLNTYFSVWYKWVFKMNGSGFYMIYAKIQPSSANDQSVKYSLYNPQNSESYMKVYINQQAYSSDGWYYLFGMYLSSGASYAVKAEGMTMNKYTKADALMFVKLW